MVAAFQLGHFCITKLDTSTERWCVFPKQTPEIINTICVKICILEKTKQQQCTIFYAFKNAVMGYLEEQRQLSITLLVVFCLPEKSFTFSTNRIIMYMAMDGCMNGTYKETLTPGKKEHQLIEKQCRCVSFFTELYLF